MHLNGRSRKKEKGDFVDYFGTPLQQDESEVLMALYDQIGEIPVVDELCRYNFGLVTQDFHVLQLSFHSR